MKSVVPKQKLVEKTAVTPLGTTEFAVLMQSFAPFPSPLRLGIAASGGPDSMALAFHVKRWLDEKTPGGKAIAFIVDHELRADSAKESIATQKELQKIGLEAEILHWQHPPVVSRLHETARKARYRLLIEACRCHGIADLLLAHQQQDQAETILMRLAKGSGVDGLAGMPAHGMMEGVRVLRPLLGVAKERLAASCAAAGLPFISDPSNGSEQFARGRLRRVVPLLATEGLTIERLCDLGARAREAKTALDHATSMLVRVGTKLDESGVIRIDLEQWRSAPRVLGLRALGICLDAVHPEDYAPEHVSLTRLFDALCADAAMPPATLRGCLIGKNEASASVMREYAAIMEMRPVKPGESVIWDQRWRVSLSKSALQKAVIQPLGNPPYETLDRLAPGLRHQIPQGRVRATLPALWLNDALALIPVLPHAQYRADAYAELVASWPPPIDR